VYTIFYVVPKQKSQGFMSDEHGGQGHPRPKRSGNRFDRAQLPNTSFRTSKTTFALCERAPFCWKSVVSTCLLPELPEWTGWRHFVVAAGTVGLLWRPPQRPLQ
jgi:hypothetical protein